MTAAERIMEVVADLAAQDRLRIAVEAGDDDPAARLERIEAGLRSGALPLDVPGQISGYWFAPYEMVPSSRPDWMPTGAVLPRAARAPLSGWQAQRGLPSRAALSQAAQAARSRSRAQPGLPVWAVQAPHSQSQAQPGLPVWAVQALLSGW